MALTVRAPAKVNWTLEVLGRRPDGYHEVLTVLQTIGFYDLISMESAVEVIVQGEPEVEGLAYRAARLLQDRTGCRLGARISVQKAIPAAAGLGGGASDAAAVLRGLNEIWGLGLSREELVGLAAELGSDIPFFLWGGTALAQGRGEMVVPLPSPSPLHLVIAVPARVSSGGVEGPGGTGKPGRAIPLRGSPGPGGLGMKGKTAYMYSLLEPEHYTDGAATRRLCRLLEEGQAIGGAIGDGDLFNVFEGVAPRAFPELLSIRAAFLAAGARQVHMAGSGPALFALASDPEEAHRLAEALIARRVPTFVTTAPAQEDGPP